MENGDAGFDWWSLGSFPNSNPVNRSDKVCQGQAEPGESSLKKYLSQLKLDSIASTTCSYRSDQGPEPGKACEGSNRQDRIKRLEESLDDIQTNAEVRRSSVLESIYQRLNALEEKISEGETRGKELDRAIRARMGAIEKSFELMRARQEEEIKERESVLGNLCKSFQRSLMQEREGIRKFQADTQAAVEARLARMGEILEQSEGTKADIKRSIQHIVSAEIPAIKAKIEDATNKVFSMEQAVKRKISQDLLELHKSIQAEGSIMSDVKRDVLLELEKALKSIKGEIKEECDERVVTQRRLKALMEETIRRLGSPL